MSRRQPKGPVLIVAQHQGLYVAFQAILARSNLITYDQDAYGLSDALTALQTGEPKAILMLEKGYETERRGAIHRYQIIEGLRGNYADIPLVYCADTADRSFFDWATGLGVTVISPSQPGKTPEKEMIAALKAVLKGSTPKVTVPPEEDAPKEKGFLARATEAGVLNPKKERPAEVEPIDGPTSTRQELDVPSGEPVSVIDDESLAWQEPEETAMTADHEDDEPVDVVDSAEEDADCEEDPCQEHDYQEPDAPQATETDPRNAKLSLPRPRRRTDPAEPKKGEGDESAAVRAVHSLAAAAGRLLWSPAPSNEERKPLLPERCLIGVFALTRGAGATRQALDLANYLQKEGLIALVAMDGKSDFDYVEHDERVSVHVPDPRQASSLISMLIGSRMYRCIICDFGTPIEMLPNGLPISYEMSATEQLINELRRCDLRICCTSEEPWHQRKEAFLKHMALHDSLLVSRTRQWTPEEILRRICSSA